MEVKTKLYSFYKCLFSPSKICISGGGARIIVFSINFWSAFGSRSHPHSVASTGKVVTVLFYDKEGACKKRMFSR